MSSYIVSEKDILIRCHAALGLPSTDNPSIDEVFLAASLRHTASVLCPCSRVALKNTLLNNLRYLTNEIDELAEKIEAMIESLIISGDLLEFDQVTTDDLDAKGTWVFLAPPSFVSRGNGEIFLLGITPDEITPLPEELSVRIKYERFVRIIKSLPSEDTASVLREFGFQEIVERTWLKAPKEETAAEYKNKVFHQLGQQTRSGPIEELHILDVDKDVGYYKGRWRSPKKETGIYVARRPQAYGAPLWGLVELTLGEPQKFLDFPLKGMPWRGCDIAWRLQMAIDHFKEAPQYYRKRLTQDGACLDFYSPLPLWAERRLMIFGKATDRQNNLFSYWLPEQALAMEEEFLRKHLWLQCKEVTLMPGGS